MESLGDLMAKYSNPAQHEVLAVKRYVSEQYNCTAQAATKGDTIVVSVPCAALANTLRLRAGQIRDACHTQKQLIFRIA